MKIPLAIGVWLLALTATTAAWAVEITAPAPGTVVAAGALVTVQAVLAAGEVASQVGFVTSEGETPAVLSGNTFQAAVRIPQDAVGPELIAAYAIEPGVGTSFGRVEVLVDPGPLKTLMVSVAPALHFAGEVAPVEVRGIFADGVIRDLSAPETGTTYTSSDAAVLGVHPFALVQARSSGVATLGVTSHGKSATARIQVTIPSGATNHIPTVTGVDQTVAPETAVTLSATAVDADGDALEYIWEQRGGRLVALRNLASANPVFVAPRVTTPHVLELMVTVRDPHGATSLPALVTITVQP
ncbi:MAG: hypothetical protein ABIO65_12700 [Nitrospiria bacterium]